MLKHLEDAEDKEHL